MKLNLVSFVRITISINKKINFNFSFTMAKANENNEAAMACYTNVLITGSEYCSSPLQRPVNERQVIDDHLVKRMIKCCLNLGCNMQAAILCQVKYFFFDFLSIDLKRKEINFSKTVSR